MIIVGELINSSRKAIAQAITHRDKTYIQDLSRRQVEAGAHFIDVNAAVDGNEIESMKWLVEIIQDAVDVPLCIDSPSAVAIGEGLKLCRQRAMVNSITAEKQRWEEVLPLVQQYQARVVALCLDDQGMPTSSVDRLRVADNLVPGLLAAGIAETDIYLDPLIMPISINTVFGIEALASTHTLRQKYPNVHAICGLSNVSYGLPERKLLNRTFMAMNVAMGMDAFILDPTDREMMATLSAAKALAGQDEFCLSFIEGVRAGRVKS